MRILVISPFFVMPPVAALVWKNMIMHPGYGVLRRHRQVLRRCSRSTGSRSYPLFSIILIVAWQWLPFATLILLTSLQSLDGEQKEAAEMDGAGFVSRFFYLTLPHLARAITVVILIQTIFLLGVFAEILVTTNGGPGYASHQPALPRLPAGAARIRRRRRLGRRHRRRHPRQHRRLLPDARRRQEPGLRRQAMARAVTTRTKVSFTVAAWVVALLIFFPILYTSHLLQDRAARRSQGFSLIPSGTLESYSRGPGAERLPQARS